MKNVDTLANELKQDHLYWIKFPSGMITIAQWDAEWTCTCFWRIGSDEPHTPDRIGGDLFYEFEVLGEAIYL